MNKPIFILGNPRSGTSLLRSIINSHDNIIIPPECGFLQFLHAKYQGFNFSIKILNTFVEDLFLTKKIEGWFLDKQNLKEYLFQKKPHNYQYLVYLVYKFYGETNQNKKVLYWGDKNNYYLHHLDLLNSIFVNSRYIQIIREPKDVVSSYLNVHRLPNSKYKPRFSNNISDIAYEWLNNNKIIASFFERENIQFLKITYEELLLYTDATIQKISKYIGVQSNNILDNFNSKKYFDEPSITMGWKQKLNDIIDKNNISNHKKFLTNNQIELIDSITKQCYT